jgi:hypothetical protein
MSPSFIPDFSTAHPLGSSLLASREEAHRMPLWLLLIVGFLLELCVNLIVETMLIAILVDQPQSAER